MIKFLVIITSFIIANSALAENKEPIGEPAGGGIVYGSEVGVSVSAPDGWIFDNKSGVSQGLHAVMYPEGSSWSKAPVMMYVNIVKMQAGETLKKFIQDDVVSFKQNSPDLKVRESSSITIEGGNKAEVWEFSGDKWGNYELIAYVQKDSSVAIYVLSSRTKEGYQKGIDAFKEMVKKSFLVKMIFK